MDLSGNDRQPLVGPYGVFVGEGKNYLVLDRFQAGCGLLGDAIHQIGCHRRSRLSAITLCRTISTMSTELDDVREFWNRVADDWQIQVGSDGDVNRRLNSDPVEVLDGVIQEDEERRLY